MLRVIQLNTLEDRAVHDKYQWDSAINFLEKSLQEKLKISQANLREQVGPGFYERWFQWSGSTPEQDKKSAIYYELERILKADANHKAVLSFEELTTVKRNLQTNANIEVDYELIRETWHPVYRTHFLQKAINRCYDCRRGFFMYSKGIENDVSTYLCDPTLFQNPFFCPKQGTWILFNFGFSRQKIGHHFEFSAPK